MNRILSKDEILDKHYQKGKHWYYFNRAKVLEAMEAYHKQFDESQPIPVNQDEIPHWYKKDTMLNWFKNNNYDVEIAEELSEQWAEFLQGAYKKGWEMGRNKDRVPENPYEYFPRSVPQDDYWKKRCEAAETLLKKYYKLIPDSAEYQNWQNTIEPDSIPVQEGLREDELWENMADKWVDFSINTFKNATALSSLEKLRDEVDEVAHEIIHGHEDLATEYADCMMCIFDSAKRQNISPIEIKKAFSEKMELNFKRDWKRNENNTYSHINQPSQESDRDNSKVK